MQRRTWAFLLVSVVAVFAVGFALAEGGMMGRGGMMGGGMMGGRTERHFYYMHTGLPAAYEGKTDPLQPGAAMLARGRRLYQENCAACHGAAGRGDGPAGVNLDPPPADLAWSLGMPIARDDFLYWTISEGGAQFHSAMPAYKSALKPDEIWAIVGALRSGSLQAGH
jgi:mono/diheme cytochrome c family protein